MTATRLRRRIALGARRAGAGARRSRSLVTSLVLRRRPADPVADVRGDAATTAPQPRSRRQHHQPAHRCYYLVRARGRDRLPDEPVQHRRRRPVPRRARSPPPSSPAQAWLPGLAATSLVILVVAMVVGAALGRHRRRAQGDPRRQRGHLDDHAERHRRPSLDRLPAAQGRRSHARQQQHRHQADPGVGAGSAASRSIPDAGHEVYGLIVARGRSSASRYWFVLEPHPLRLRPARDRRSPRPPRSPAAST